MIAGTETGWVAGQLARTAYAMWLLWSGLSSRLPSQQLGKRTCSRRKEPRCAGQVGTVLDGGTPLPIPQLQVVTRMPCGAEAVASPAITRRLFGNGVTRAMVARR